MYSLKFNKERLVIVMKLTETHNKFVRNKLEVKLNKQELHIKI